LKTITRCTKTRKCWLLGLGQLKNTLNQKYPQPEGLFTTLVDTAVSNDKNGLKVLSAHLINPGKYEEASAYFRKFMTEFFDIESYTYEFSTWSTIEEAMESLWSQLVKSHLKHKECHTR